MINTSCGRNGQSMVSKLRAFLCGISCLFLCCGSSESRKSVESAIAFPSYCSRNVEENVIELLHENIRNQYELKQVQIVMRHGARVLHARSSCWQGYNVTWQCQARNNLVKVSYDLTCIYMVFAYNLIM